MMRNLGVRYGGYYEKATTQDLVLCEPKPGRHILICPTFWPAKRREARVLEDGWADHSIRVINN